MSDEKIKVTKTVRQYDIFDVFEGEPIQKIIERFEYEKATYEDEDWADLRFDVAYDCGYDDYNTTITLVLIGERLETDKECASRIKKREAAAERRKTKKEKEKEKEVKELERLAKKHGYVMMHCSKDLEGE
jgi:hypothetical protein